MNTVWICLLIFSSAGSSYGPAVAVVDNLATVQDCRRVGQIWLGINGYGNKYRCIQVRKK
jgi:hypothetical protein